MESVKDIPENIRLALDFSRSFATAKPNIGRTEKEHIEGLANLLERVSDEREALQLMLNNRDDLDDQLTTLEQRRYAEQQTREAAERRVDDLKGLLRRAKPYIPWSNFGSVPYQWNLEVQDALNPTAEAESHE